MLLFATIVICKNKVERVKGKICALECWDHLLGLHVFFGINQGSLLHLTFMGPCIVNVFFQVYQQDATLYNIIYYCQCSTCFRWLLRPSSGAQNCTHSIWYMSSLLPSTASGSSKQLDIYQMLYVQFLSSWWWAERPPETCRALTVIKNVV